MQINLDTKNLKTSIDGNKTYFLLLSGAAVIVLNHFGLLPPEYVPAGLDPNSWLIDLFMLATGAAGRSALKKLEADTLTPAQQARADELEAILGPMMSKYAHLAMDERGVARQAPQG